MGAPTKLLFYLGTFIFFLSAVGHAQYSTDLDNTDVLLAKDSKGTEISHQSCGQTMIGGQIVDFAISLGKNCKEARESCKSKLESIPSSSDIGSGFTCPAHCPNLSWNISTNSSRGPGYCGGRAHQKMLKEKYRELYPDSRISDKKLHAQTAAECGWYTSFQGSVTCSSI